MQVVRRMTSRCDSPRDPERWPRAEWRRAAVVHALATQPAQMELAQAAENAERRELFPVRKKRFDRGFEGSGRWRP